MGPTESRHGQIAAQSRSTRDEIEWERVAKFHLEHGEPNAAALAATIRDTLQFYRLHMAAKGAPGWQG